jgi:tetratricopeptide (TPR) repeat protein
MSGYDLSTLESLQRILHAIDLAAESRTFALYFVECSLPGPQDEYIAHLAQEARTYHITLLRLDLSNRIIEDLRQTTLDFLNRKFPQQVPPRIALAITGLEASILLDSNEAHPAVLQVTNLGRENYPRTLPYPFTIWLSDSMLRKVQSAAPDFWSWRSAEPERFAVNESLLKREIDDALSLNQIQSWSEAVGQVSRLERLLEAYDQLQKKEDAEPELFSQLGDAYKFLEKYQKAHSSYSKALEIAEELDNPEQRASLLNKLGIILRQMGDPDRALAFFRQYLAEQRQDLIGQGAALNNIGLIHLDKGELEGAIGALKQALSINESSGNQQAVSNTLGNLGLAYHYRGEFQLAIQYHQRSLEISQGLDEQGSYWKDLRNLGLAYSAIGDLVTTLKHYLHAVAVSEWAGDLIGAKRCLMDAAQCSGQLAVQGMSQSQREQWASQMEQLALLAMARPGATPTGWLKEVTSRLDFDSLTVALYEQALTIARDIRDRVDEYNILTTLAGIHLRHGDEPKAVSYYEEVLRLAKEMVDPERELSCLASLIRLYGRDEPDIAVRYKEMARLLLRGARALKTVMLNAWLSDDRGRIPGILTRGNRYTLCLCMGDIPAGYWDSGSAETPSSSFIQAEIICNLAVKSDFLADGSPGDGAQGTAKFTDLNLPASRGQRPLALVGSERPPGAPSHRGEGEPAPADSSGPPPGAGPTAQPGERLTGLLDNQAVIKFDVNIKGIGFECSQERGELAVSWERGSNILFLPVTPIESGKVRLDIKCEANGIPFDVTLSAAAAVEPPSSANYKLAPNAIVVPGAPRSIAPKAQSRGGEIFLEGEFLIEPEPLTVQYGKLLLPEDRRVRALLQMDWIAGTPRPELAVRTSAGLLRLEDLLREVGIDLEVAWRNELPVAVMGPDHLFSDAELLSTLETYREETPPGVWHFYVIYGGRHQHGSITSLMFDYSRRGGRRRGLAVFPGGAAHRPVFLILHDMGHMLNLPHPWETAYGNSRSVMSLPERWSNWSWDDPSVYRFDAFGQQHIRRAPEEYVRPGASAYLDYGAPAPWLKVQAGA